MHKRKDKVLEAVVMAELGYITSRNGNTGGGLKMIYQSLEQAEASRQRTSYWYSL
ncbi:MAG: hypothetical protein WKF59_19905 [Chitinophagaceae bacterium]